AERGFFPRTLLATFNQDGGQLPEHPGRQCVPGVEVDTGSLGHGLSLGIGMALAARLQRQPSRVFVVLSDGECNEGSVWEAAMFAPRHRLGNLLAIVDYNKWQATGRSEEVLALAPLRDKWQAFGWETVEIDGHDPRALLSTLTRWSDAPDRPRAIIAHTVKGK